ncbi:AMIN-like domain-containing (lipo)protein [Blastococcus sp. SYSU D00695]
MSTVRRLRPAPAVLSAVLAAVLVSGCAGEEGASADPTPAAGGSATTPAADRDATAAPSEDGAPPSAGTPGETTAQAEPEDGARVTVTDIRTGRHDGFDRVVFEVGGEGLPGWDVRYVDVASSQGRGEVVPVAGQAILQVTLSGVAYPYETGVEEFSAAGAVPGAGTRTVTEVVFDSTFEGTTVAFVGTTSRAPFRVSLLQDPTRVVLEVPDPA